MQVYARKMFFKAKKNMGHLLLKREKGRQQNIYRTFNYLFNSLSRLNLIVVLYASLNCQTYIIESYATIFNSVLL